MEEGYEGAERGNHIKFPCYIRHLYGESIDIHVLDFKWRSVNFDNLLRNKILAYNYLFPYNHFPYMSLV